MESSLDATTTATLSLLESRLLRVEHQLYGPYSSNPPSGEYPVGTKVADLEKRLAALVSRVRVYGELLKIYRAHPSLFHTANPSDPPTQMSLDARKATVLASAASFPATESSLRAVADCPIPDPSQSTALIAQMERMKALEATQIAQAAEMAELRTSSEAIIRRWYESNALASSQLVAEVEGRVEMVERRVRRSEREKEAENAI